MEIKYRDPFLLVAVMQCKLFAPPTASPYVTLTPNSVGRFGSQHRFHQILYPEKRLTERVGFIKPTRYSLGAKTSERSCGGAGSTKVLGGSLWEWRGA